jgi:pectate lyase
MNSAIHCWNLVLAAVFLCSISFSEGAFGTAFPGAEGYGAQATGGRGGQVIKVTNLNSSGSGSLQAALDEEGPRIIVFEVSGIIEGDLEISSGDFTLAGETAPGGGITIAGSLVTVYDDFSVTNFIIRHLRIRPRNLSGDQGDAIGIPNNSNFILDHVSVSWGSDETVDVYRSHDFTVQWCTIEESATYAGHSDGNFHNYGLINGPDGSNVSIHHTLFAHHRQRTPAIANGMSDIINNVSYNFWRGFNHHNDADTTGFNFIGNYYKAGPNVSSPIVILIDDEDGTSGPYYWIEDIYYNGVVTDPWSEEDVIGVWPTSISPAPSQAASRFATPPVTTHSSIAAYDLVLNYAGAWPRDTVTIRTINEVLTGTGSWGRSVPGDLMAGLTATSSPADRDNDGMPDDWEAMRGLNPDLADHNGNDDGDEYTNIEEYQHYRSNLVIYAINPEIKGDIDGNYAVELRDAIVGLKIISEQDYDESVNPNSDVNSDSHLGLAEVVFVLRNLLTSLSD